MAALLTDQHRFRLALCGHKAVEAGLLIATKTGLPRVAVSMTD